MELALKSSSVNVLGELFVRVEGGENATIKIPVNWKSGRFETSESIIHWVTSKFSWSKLFIKDSKRLAQLIALAIMKEQAQYDERIDSVKDIEWNPMHGGLTEDDFNHMLNTWAKEPCGMSFSAYIDTLF